MSRLLFPWRFCADTRSDGKLSASVPGNGAATEPASIKRVAKFHHDRDAWALGRLTHQLTRPGDCVEALFNVKGKDLEEQSVRSMMRKGDLVLVTTRVPADDKERRTRKRLVAGDNWLETQAIERSRQFFDWCDRKNVLLTPDGAACLAPQFKDRSHLQFQVNDDDASYEAYAAAPLENGAPRRRLRPEDLTWLTRRTGPLTRRATAGYILCLRELWDDGPDALIVFGMSGPVTFGFAMAVQEIWAKEFPAGFTFEESELIFAEITSARDTADAALVPPVHGHPTYWRQWHLDWNRKGALASWDAVCPKAPIEARLEERTKV